MNMKTLVRAIMISVLLSGELIPCSLSAQIVQRDIVSGESSSEYFIEAGDILNIHVFPAEEFSKELTVQPDGNIEIPLLGSFKVAGLKSSELEKVLTSKFSKYVSNPTITINVRKFSSSRVAVIGQIHSPGYYEYREGMTILDLVAQSGGLLDYAKTDKVRIFRKNKTADGNVLEESFHVDLEVILEGQPDKNVKLSSGDIVYIPRKAFSTFSKWLSDNFVPWLTIITCAVTVGIITHK